MSNDISVLNSDESSQLARHEAVIEKGIKTFVEVGLALQEIRESRLYRGKHATFEDYCRVRWGMSRVHAHRMIEAARIAENVLPVGNIPTTERQARPLTRLEPDQQREAWQRAVATSPNGKPTAKHVEKVVRQVRVIETRAELIVPVKEDEERTEEVFPGLPEAEPFPPRILVGSPLPPKPPTRPTFNQTNEMVEWAWWTWNPVTGCKHDCVYCYARDIANRFYPQKFEPTFHPERLEAPRNSRLPDRAQSEVGWRNVFVCSMADLFGRWVPDQWIEDVFASCRKSPEWNYLFLTKFPLRYEGLDFPETAWVGTSVDEQKRVANAEKAFSKVKAPIKWLSLEPLREPLKFSRLDLFDWVVIGGQSRSTQAPEFLPPFEWVADIVTQAKQAGCKVYIKPNIGFDGPTRPREYPGRNEKE